MSNNLGLYIHIPFCQKQCHYCDFLTFVGREDQMRPYIDHLRMEIKLHAHRSERVDTIYFGGGTPSYLPTHLIREVMTALRENFAVSPDCEIAIEMNPESVTEEALLNYLDLGFNRFSMGVQSFDDRVLRLMGRLHNKESVLQKIDLMEKLGIDNYSIDLMFANPGQDFQVLEQDIKTLKNLPINHVSYYSLMYKENTAFYRWLKTGQIKPYNDEVEREMYHYIQSELRACGLQQYEISNFARPGYESRHNMKYWQLEDYLGLGLGASSNIGLVRTTIVPTFEEYYQLVEEGQFPCQVDEELTIEDREKEYIILSMRLLKGFSIAKINQRFGIDFETKYQEAIHKHLQTGLVQIDQGNFQFTDKGLDIGNQFYLDII
ncbi:radical SAM family heme chaperone HemW [Hutsoniella sourekii]